MIDIPFDIILTEVPAVINADLMTVEEIGAKLKEGYDDIEKGNVQEASTAFKKFRDRHEEV